MPSTDFPSYQFFTPDVVPIQIGTVILGILLLLAGRRLFWLFVAALGFVTATDFVAPLIDRSNSSALLVVGIVAGIAGAVLAIFVQKVAVGLAGAVAGAYYLNLFIEAAALQDLRWIAITVGAVLGAILMIVLFKWALIIFSSVAGAHLIASTFPFSPQLKSGVFLILVIIGLLVQARSSRTG